MKRERANIWHSLPAAQTPTVSDRSCSTAGSEAAGQHVYRGRRSEPRNYRSHHRDLRHNHFRSSRPCSTRSVRPTRPSSNWMRSPCPRASWSSSTTTWTGTLTRPEIVWAARSNTRDSGQRSVCDKCSRETRPSRQSANGPRCSIAGVLGGCMSWPIVEPRALRRAAGGHDPLRQQYHHRGLRPLGLGRRLRPGRMASAELHPTIRSNDNGTCWCD
jgi:hypothetical protein